MAEDSGIETRRDGPVATIALARPERRNAFDAPMLRALASAAEHLGADEAVAAVILRGAGDAAFSAGADLKSLAAAAGDEDALADRFAEIEAALDAASEALLALPQPLIAAMAGACMGGAVRLALCADVRVAGAGFRLATPAVRNGLLYPVDAIERMVAVAGPAAARALFLSGETLSGEAALRCGFLDELAPEADPTAAAERRARAFAEAPPAALRACKRALAECVSARPDREALRALQRAVNEGPEARARMAAAAARLRPR